MLLINRLIYLLPRRLIPRISFPTYLASALPRPTWLVSLQLLANPHGAHHRRPRRLAAALAKITSSSTDIAASPYVVAASGGGGTSISASCSTGGRRFPASSGVGSSFFGHRFQHLGATVPTFARASFNTSDTRCSIPCGWLQLRHSLDATTAVPVPAPSMVVTANCPNTPTVSRSVAGARSLHRGVWLQHHVLLVPASRLAGLSMWSRLQHHAWPVLAPRLDGSSMWLSRSQHRT